MPATQAQYGHSARGHNLQNLRDVGGTKVHTLPGGFKAPFDWQREVDEVINTYKNEHVTSQKIRGAAAQNISDGKRNLSKHVNATEEALASKIRKCQDRKAHLDKALLDVDLELQNLNRTATKLQKLLSRRKAALELAERRMQVRAKRPNRELTSDRVQQNLINQGSILHEFVHRLERGLRAVEHNTSKLQQIRGALSADASDKAQAIQINRQALVAEASAAKGADLTAKYTPPIDPITYPHHWANSTESNIKTAESVVADSQLLRQTLHKVISEASDAASRAATNLENSMQQRIDSTRKNRRALEDQLRKISDETARARTQRDSLRDAAKARSGPLLLVRHRAQMRRSLPSRELVADEADHALRREMRALQMHCNEIDAHEAAIDAQIRRLEGGRQQVEAHLQEKNEAERVDLECAMLDGRSNYARPASVALSDISSMYSFRPKSSSPKSNVSPCALPPSMENQPKTGVHFSSVEDTRPNTASSAELSSNAKQRIQMLEEELQRARTERKEMEESVKTLAIELS